MTGKEKCEFLKEIRRRMAAENGIPYKPRECHHEGDCLGTCPLCDKEAADLLVELKRKELSGEDIHVDNDAIEVLEQISGGKKDIEDDENEVQLLGDIPAGGYIRSEEELYDNIKEERPIMGIIGEDYWLDHVPEPEREPDITWNLDEDDPIISNPERIISKDADSEDTAS